MPDYKNAGENCKKKAPTDQLPESQYGPDGSVVSGEGVKGNATIL